MQPSGYIDRPDYRVDLLRRRNKVTASSNGTVLAETSHPLVVDEQDHGLVFYFPRTDVRLDELEAIDLHTRCPYKGDASYWRLRDGDSPVAWTYDEPYQEVAIIAGYVAFYQDRVDVKVGVADPAVSK